MSASTRLIVLALIGLLSACATIDSLTPGNGSKFVANDVGYDRLWLACVRAMSNNLTIVRSDQSLGVIKSESRAGIATSGEVVGLWINPARSDANTYRVEVLSLKRSRGQITGQNWEPSVVANIRAELAAMP